MNELYELPDGWEWKKLEDIFLIQRGGSPRPIKDYITDDEDGINWIKIGDTKKGEKYITQTAQKIKPEGLKKSRLVVEGDFLMSNSMSFGRPYIVKTKGAIHDGWLLMREKLDNTDKDFFYYLLSSNYMYQQFSSKASGTTVKNLNINLVKSTDIPLPPFGEQQKIVSKLNNLFEKIDKSIALHQKNINEANIFMGSVLNEVFGELEDKYELKILKEISNIISGYAFKSGEFSDSNEIKSIKITNVGVQNFVEDDENKLSEKLLEKLSKYTANSGDIVIALTRPYISNGLKVTFVPKTYNGAFINQRVAAIQSKKNISIINYIYHYLCTSNVLSNVMELSKTLNQPNLSIKDLSNFNIPLPPLNVQQKVVSYLDEISEKIEKIKSVQKEKMESLVALKASILDQAFKGEL